MKLHLLCKARIVEQASFEVSFMVLLQAMIDSGKKSWGKGMIGVLTGAKCAVPSTSSSTSFLARCRGSWM